MEVKDDRISWFGGNVDISMKVLLREKQIYFSIPDKVELGPYNIVSGNNFRVVAGHCNSGNGELIISDCYEYE
jgi:hypothetical protein